MCIRDSSSSKLSQACAMRSMLYERPTPTLCQEFPTRLVAPAMQLCSTVQTTIRPLTLFQRRGRPLEQLGYGFVESPHVAHRRLCDGAHRKQTIEHAAT
eukprot:1536956-Pyramimonas_sp.AAC.1